MLTLRFDIQTQLFFNPENGFFKRQINTVSYTPATSTEQEEGENLKNQLIEDSNKPSMNQGITVSFSAATQDTPGGPVIVKALINGTSSGNCNLTLSKGSIIKKYSAPVKNLETYYGCDGFSIPVADLSNGNWKAKLIITNDSSTGSAEQSIEVKI